MPISDFMSNKWDARLYNWLLWRSGEDRAGGGVKISSAYSMEDFGTGSRSGYRECGVTVLAGEAMDTDRLMVEIEASDHRIYAALVEWTRNDGTRGAQAARLSTGGDTYRDWVDSGKRELERLSRAKLRLQIKNHRLSPERR